MRGTGRKCSSMLGAILALGCFLLLAPGASAASFTVTTQTDSNDGACTPALCSLRDAVVAADTAGGSSTITLPAGDYQLTLPASTASGCSTPVSGCDPSDPTHGDLDVDNNASIAITGAGAATTTIDPNQIDRAFAVQKGAGLTLSGVTIRNGLASQLSSGLQDGGAVYSDGGLTLSADAFTGNQAVGNGGAIYLASDAPLLSITGSEFSSNQNATSGSAGSGGAIFLDPATTAATVSEVITHSSFIDDGSSASPSTYGGAIDLEAGTLSISASTIRGSEAQHGGAISQGEVAEQTSQPCRCSLEISGSTLSANQAFDGGGIAMWGGTLSMNSSTLARNSADLYGGADGGGLLISGPAPVSLSLRNSTLARNTAPNGYGGGLADEADDVHVFQQTIQNDTIASNQAGIGGGGIFQPGAAATGSSYRGTIVAGNGAGDCGNDINLGIGAAQDHGHNLDSDGTCFKHSGGPGDRISSSPLLGPLRANGGPTPTMALRPGSPAIDAGPAQADCPAADQRGQPRPDPGESACDIGALETQDVSLTVSAAGSGHGSVTGTGISCPASCAESVPPGTEIGLMARPASGSRFAGWSGGGCTGTGDCAVTVTSSEIVTASFTVLPRLELLGPPAPTAHGVALKLRCVAPTAEHCPTELLLSTRKAKRLATVGRRRLILTAGPTQTVTIALDQTGRRWLRHSHKLPVRLRIGLGRAGHTTTVAQRRLTIRG